MKNRKIFLCIALILTAIILSMCSKKAEAQESKKSSATGSAKTEAYNSESDFKIDIDTNVKNGVIITEYIGTKNEVNIPPNIKNSTVTSIGEYVFMGFERLTSVTIPDSVTSIGEYAFSVCENLTSVTIPNSVKSIGECAFSGCINLTSITIPNNVRVIRKGTFGRTHITSITIPNSVRGIEEYAFYDCTNLTSVTFAKGSAITDSNFSENAFMGDKYSVNLKEAYLSGGAGTYKLKDDDWIKQ